MDILPLELHAQIFQAACVDDGTTARALSLVSHYMRDVSKPFLYQSVVVAGLDALTTFTHKLTQLPPHLRRIRHLFLSDWTHKASLNRVIGSDDASMDRYDQEEAIIMRILEYAAPSLETLAFSVFCPYNATPLIGHLFAMSFPRLTHLAVHGFYPFPSTTNAMPRLTRLYLSGNRNPHGLFQTGGLSAACPNLADLTVTGLVSAASFPLELRTALLAHTPNSSDNNGGEGDKPSDSLLQYTLPPKLESLSVEYAPYTRKTAFANITYQKMKSLLHFVPTRAVRYDAKEIGQVVDVYQVLMEEWLGDHLNITV